MRISFKKVKKPLYLLLFTILLIGLMPPQAMAGNQDIQIPSVKKPTFPDRDYNINDYGAEGDGETKSTKAFEKAIEAANKAGGGRVIVPEGTYLTGAIHLKSNINLHVQEDATIKFSQDLEDYLPLVKTRWEGTELYNYSPLIYAYEKKNVAITGKGTLDGNADNNHWWPWKGKKEAGWEEGEPEQSEDAKLLIKMAEDNVPVDQRKFGKGHYLRPNMVQFYNSENILVEGVTINDSPMWHVHPVLSKNVIVRNVDIEGHGPNNDGVNPESSKDVLIENNTFNNGDDNIAIKSGKGADGRRVDVPSENIFILGNHMKDGHGAVTVGSEMTGGVKNVFAQNNVMDSPNLWNVLRIKTNPDRGGYVENVYFTDNIVKNVDKEAVRINTNYEDVTSGDNIPIIKNIEIKNLESNGGEYAIKMHGLKQSPIQDVRIIDSNFNNVQKNADIENVEGLNLDNVSINGEPIYELLPPNDTQDMMKLVERMEESGEISNSDVARLLTTHLIVVNHFEEEDVPKKVIKHLKGFVTLLDHQKENELISEVAYNNLKDDAKYLMEEWK